MNSVAVATADGSELSLFDAVESKSFGQRVMASGHGVKPDILADVRVPEERVDAPSRHQASVMAAVVSDLVTMADVNADSWSPDAVESEPSEHHVESGGVVSDTSDVLTLLAAMLQVLTAILCVVCVVEALRGREAEERRQRKPKPLSEGDQASASVEPCCCMGHP